MAPFTDTTLLEQIFRPLTADERATAGALIPIASAMLRAKVPDIDNRITAGTLDPSLAAYAVASMVQRVLIGRSRPEGVAVESETLGPWAESTTYLSPTALASQLEITPDDLAGIIAIQVGIPRVATVRLKQPVDHLPHRRVRDARW